jgi:hypothetical protein
VSVWGALEVAAWVLSAGIALWMVVDLVRVGREYDEDFLTTAVEIDHAPLDDEEGGGG